MLLHFIEIGLKLAILYIFEMKIALVQKQILARSNKVLHIPFLIHLSCNVISKYLCKSGFTILCRAHIFARVSYSITINGAY